MPLQQALTFEAGLQVLTDEMKERVNAYITVRSVPVIDPSAAPSTWLVHRSCSEDEAHTEVSTATWATLRGRAYCS